MGGILRVRRYGNTKSVQGHFNIFWHGQAIRLNQISLFIVKKEITLQLMKYNIYITKINYYFVTKWVLKTAEIDRKMKLLVLTLFNSKNRRVYSL